MAHRIVGQPLGRLDGADKVSGAARYSADVTFPGARLGQSAAQPAASRAHRAHRHVEGACLPGVLAVLTAKDPLWHRLLEAGSWSGV